MRIGPNGEKRPADPVASAVMVGRIATGLAEEEYVDAGRREGGLKGGKARAAKMSAKRRKDIARKGADARWG